MSPSSPTRPAIRQLMLVKQDQRWLFRYAPGEEQTLLHCLAQCAGDPRQDFDWFDAAVLCHRMGERLGEQLKQLMDSVSPKDHL